jgi:hypothetical protein
MLSDDMLSAGMLLDDTLSNNKLLLKFKITICMIAWVYM